MNGDETEWARRSRRKPTQRARADQNSVLNLPSRKEEKPRLNPVDVTEELKPLPPARHDRERSANVAIPLCESERDGVQ